jgi:fibronectin type 3 domain-containing protein/V8-like Glu-specific endopeptidase
MNVSISLRVAAATFAIAGLCSGVLAQQDPAFGPPPPAPNASTNSTPVVSDKPIGVFKPDTDKAITLPEDMPPLGKIPPMPMSAGGYRGGPLKQSGGRMIMYDATTGRVEEAPAAIVSHLEDMQGGGFTGLYPVGETEPGTDWNSTMTTISDASLTSWPYRANCKLAMRRLKTDGTYAWYVCSGTMIDAETVLTAGHCVYTHTAGLVEGWATEIYVFPGWDGVGDIYSDAPDYPVPETIFNSWGFARGTAYASWTSWTSNSDYDGDVGLVKVSRAVGMLTGWYGWNYGNTCGTIQGRTYSNISYPAEGCDATRHTGAQMYSWAGQIDSCPDNQLQIDTGSGCTTAVWGGMSGSSMYFISGTDRYISAVCSTSNRSSTANYCRLFEGFVNSMNDTIIPETRTSTLDLQALDCNLADTSWAAGTTVTGFNFTATNPTNANPASQTYSYNIYLSSNTNISASDTLLSQQSFTHDYAAMQNLTVNSSGFSIPTSVAPGTYYLGVVLDAGTGGDNNSGNDDSDTWDAVRVTISSCINPAAPTGFSSINFQHCDHNELNWTDIANATTYQVWRSTTNDSATATLRTTVATNTYNDFSVVDGTRYYYWLKAIYPCGTSGFSAVADGETNYAPNAATGVSATDGTICGAVDVTWTAAARATNYRIYRGNSNNFALATQIGTDTASPYTDSTGGGGATYYYFIVAENVCGSSANSGGNPGWSSPELAPPNSASVTATTNLCTGVNLTWASNLWADTFYIYRNSSNNVLGSTLLGSSITNSFTDITIPAGTSAFYFIQSSNECGLSGFTSGRAGARRAAPASAPTGLAASDATQCVPTITLIWNSVANTDSYKVYRNTTNNSATATLLGAVASNAYEDITAFGNTPYFYWVKASNACGDSAFSVVDGGTRGGLPPAPADVNATDGTTCNSVTVTWTYPLTPDTDFSVYRNTVNNPLTATLLAGDTASPFIDGSVVGTTTYYYFVRVTNPCGTSAASVPNTGRAGSSISFSSHPADQTVTEGQPVSFSVSVGGASTYRWRRNGSNLFNGGPISGAVSPTLTINPTTAADAGLYDCVVTSTCGNATSNTALLTVNPAGCAADFNQDGGVDGADINAFFEAWEAGEGTADVNLDGGVDGADVDAFFLVWEAGGC